MFHNLPGCSAIFAQIPSTKAESDRQRNCQDQSQPNQGPQADGTEHPVDTLIAPQPLFTHWPFLLIFTLAWPVHCTYHKFIAALHNRARPGRHLRDDRVRPGQVPRQCAEGSRRQRLRHRIPGMLFSVIVRFNALT